MDRYDESENAGYPTLCKGRFEVNGETYYAIEEPTSLNTLEMLPEMLRIGIAAIKIEGRQRSPAYVEQVTKVWRAAIDAARRTPQNYQVSAAWMTQLNKVAEGQQHTLGAYNRPWKSSKTFVGLGMAASRCAVLRNCAKCHKVDTDHELI